MEVGRSVPRCMYFLFGILTIGLLAFALGAEEAASDTPEKNPEAVAEADAAPLTKTETLSVEGMRVVRDPETGELRAPNAAEARTLSASELLKRPKSAPPKGEMRADGTLALAIPGLHLRFAVATVNDEGKVVTNCSDSDEEAEEEDSNVQ